MRTNNMRVAVTRDVSPGIANCELTYLSRVSIDVALARAQHKVYARILSDLGCTMAVVESDPALPDSVFVEDTAIVLDEIAVITRPGAESRRPETAAVARTLNIYRPLVEIRSPGTLDGGDVMRVGKMIYVGRSGRSNAAGIEQLRALTAEYGYRVHDVEVSGCLHLKSAVSRIGPDTILLNPDWVSASDFKPLDVVTIDPTESHAANALLVGTDLVYPNSFPRTRDRLLTLGYNVFSVDVFELQKAEGAVTCCSIVFDVQDE
jgi:dimethylargininase